MDDDLYRRLSRARELMDDCYNDALDIKLISQTACISPYHFIRLFKNAFRTTPHQYLKRRRIDKAKELLIRSLMSVKNRARCLMKQQLRISAICWSGICWGLVQWNRSGIQGWLRKLVFDDAAAE
jgi:AraC-like DNA-binding protein